MLVIATYTPPSQCKNYFINELPKILDKCRGSYENTVILEDFNMKPINQILQTLFIFLAYIINISIIIFSEIFYSSL